MNCWICGAEAETGEHRIKASDLKSEFGTVSQKNPLYLHTEEKSNLKINSIKRPKELKSKALICSTCNNSRTAPFDRAWQTMSNHLRSKKHLDQGKTIKLEKVFPGKTKAQMLNVHLYFIKLFGCAIQEHSIPIDTADFSAAIMNKCAHDKVFISFGYSGLNFTGNTNVHTAISDKRVMYAVWYYLVGNISVAIIYSEPKEDRIGLKNTWHPLTLKKRLKLASHKA